MPDLIDLSQLEKISPLFKTEEGQKLGRRLYRLAGVERANIAYNKYYEYHGAAFARKLLEDIGVRYKVSGLDVLDSLRDSSFITISNHAYGGLDGVMLIDLVASRFPDFKVMVNKFLTLVKPLDENFISVIPRTEDTDRIMTQSLTGVREALAQIHDKKPLGFFPAGAVSNLHLRDWFFPWTSSAEVKRTTAYSQQVRAIYDRPWQESVIRIIKKARVPIIPIRFFDRNSMYFYMLGKINWRVRAIQLPREVFNKGGKNIRIAIGKPITPQEQGEYTSMDEFGRFLRSSVYEIPLPESYTVVG